MAAADDGQMIILALLLASVALAASVWLITLHLQNASILHDMMQVLCDAEKRVRWLEHNVYGMPVVSEREEEEV